MNLLQSQYTYITLILLTITGPFCLSFDKKVAFHKEWKWFLASMLPTSVAYILWDIIATHTGVWKFNSSFLLGSFMGNLPLEEYLFFIVVPYACLFIYACLKAYFPTISKPQWHNTMIWSILALCITMMALAPGHSYTWSTFGLLAITFLILYWVKFTQHLSYLLLAWAIALLPMAFVNGILTANPVLIYNDAENLGFRVGTIPFEDFFYNLLYMTWMISIYEYFKYKNGKAIA